MTTTPQRDIEREAAEKQLFEEWWTSHGQYCRSGGGNYEKTFAYRAWQARAAQATAEPVGEVLGPNTWPGGQWHFKPAIGWEEIGNRTKLYAAPASAPSDGAADAVDYKLLLAKYIEHVGAEEGCTFISQLFRGSNGKWQGMSDRCEFDQLEKEALEAAEKVYLNASTHTTTGGENE